MKYRDITEYIGQNNHQLLSGLGPELYCDLVNQQHALLNKLPRKLSPIAIRPLAESDRDQWLGMYINYYVVDGKLLLNKVQPKKIDALWQSLLAQPSNVRGKVAVNIDGELVGFTHAEITPDSKSCYMEDLYVAPIARGGLVGPGLMEALRQDGLHEGWPELHWKCNSNDNPRGIAFYSSLEGATLRRKAEPPSGWWHFAHDMNKPVRHSGPERPAPGVVIYQHFPQV